MDTRLKNVNIQLASLVHYLEFFWSRFFFFFFLTSYSWIESPMKNYTKPMVIGEIY